MKKLLAAVFCLAMLITAIPLSAHASKERDELCRKMESDYNRMLEETGNESMHGYCGTAVGWQLYLTGVNSYVIKANGNDQYDLYRDARWTSGGHAVKDYPIEKYPTLLDALNAASYYGQRDVYNLLVGFESTNTEDGQRFGHACVIYAILDGMVYYTESFSVGGNPEGQAICRSIADFAQGYENWAVYEGTVEFGKKAGDRDADAVNVFVRTLKETPLYTKMDPESDVLRTLHRGERLHALHLTVKDGVYYYQIDEGDRLGYLPAASVELLCTDPDGVSLEEARLPQMLETGSSANVSGSVVAFTGEMEKLQITVSEDGKTVLQAETENCGKTAALKQKDLQLAWETLVPGTYTVQMTVQVREPMALLGLPVSRRERRILYEETLTVADELPEPDDAREGIAPEIVRPDGWSLDGGQWYLWSEGKPVTGWYKEDGIWYYLAEDGGAVTGEQEIDGIRHSFTPTGTLRSGWEETYGGTRYYRQGGIAATSLQRIDGAYYLFSEDGYLLRNSWTEDGQFYTDENGALAEGWTETETGKFFFVKGRVAAKEIDKNGKNRFPILDILMKTE